MKKNENIFFIKAIRRKQSVYSDIDDDRTTTTYIKTVPKK